MLLCIVTEISDVQSSKHWAQFSRPSGSVTEVSDVQPLNDPSRRSRLSGSEIEASDVQPLNSFLIPPGKLSWQLPWRLTWPSGSTTKFSDEQPLKTESSSQRFLGSVIESSDVQPENARSTM